MTIRELKVVNELQSALNLHQRTLRENMQQSEIAINKHIKAAQAAPRQSTMIESDYGINEGPGNGYESHNPDYEPWSGGISAEPSPLITKLPDDYSVEEIHDPNSGGGRVLINFSKSFIQFLRTLNINKQKYFVLLMDTTNDNGNACTESIKKNAQDLLKMSNE